MLNRVLSLKTFKGSQRAKICFKKISVNMNKINRIYIAKTVEKPVTFLLFHGIQVEPKDQ